MYLSELILIRAYWGGVNEQVLHLILLIIFLLMGIFGLIFHVPIGVFVATALVPWEVRMVLINQGKFRPRLIKGCVIMAIFVGVSYFLIHHLWQRALFIVGIQAYTYFVLSRDKKRMKAK